MARQLVQHQGKWLLLTPKLETTGDNFDCNFSVEFQLYDQETDPQVFVSNYRRNLSINSSHKTACTVLRNVPPPRLKKKGCSISLCAFTYNVWQGPRKVIFGSLHGLFLGIFPCSHKFCFLENIMEDIFSIFHFSSLSVLYERIPALQVMQTGRTYLGENKSITGSRPFLHNAIITRRTWK